MYQTIMEQLSLQLPEKQFEEIRGRKIHLGIFMEPGLSAIMDAWKEEGKHDMGSKQHRRAWEQL